MEYVLGSTVKLKAGHYNVPALPCVEETEKKIIPVRAYEFHSHNERLYKHKGGTLMPSALRQIRYEERLKARDRHKRVHTYVTTIDYNDHIITSSEARKYIQTGGMYQEYAAKDRFNTIFVEFSSNNGEGSKYEHWYNIPEFVCSAEETYNAGAIDYMTYQRLAAIEREDYIKRNKEDLRFSPA